MTAAALIALTVALVGLCGLLAYQVSRGDKAIDARADAREELGRMRVDMERTRFELAGVRRALDVAARKSLALEIIDAEPFSHLAPDDHVGRERLLAARWIAEAAATDETGVAEVETAVEPVEATAEA